MLTLINLIVLMTVFATDVGVIRKYVNNRIYYRE